MGAGESANASRPEMQPGDRHVSKAQDMDAGKASMIAPGMAQAISWRVRIAMNVMGFAWGIRVSLQAEGISRVTSCAHQARRVP